MITAEQLQLHDGWVRNGSGKRLEAAAANLGYANLGDANLRYANLGAANLRYANLCGANLRAADLSYANLRGASLRAADLSYADFSGADFSGANLRDASLNGVTGNMREIKSAQFDQWAVTWSADVLAIGCQQHAIEEWRNADPRWIAAMDPGASDWWSRYGALVLQLIDASPATGRVLEVQP